MKKSDLKKLIRECIAEVIGKESISRKNPFINGRTCSGWLLSNGEFRWADTHSAHDSLAKTLGYADIDALRKSGGIRVWADGIDKIITLSVDRFSDLSEKLQNRVESLAMEYDAAIRDDRGNIVSDYRN